MNQEQVMGLIRQVMPLVGGVATMFGIMSPEQVGDIMDNVLAAVGPLMIITSMVWSMVSKTDKAIVEKAMAIPQVMRIVTSSTAAGVKLADSIPNENVVSVPTLST